MTRIGYARVSSTDQGLALQIERLKAAGCEIVRSEKVTGSTRQGQSDRIRAPPHKRRDPIRGEEGSGR